METLVLVLATLGFGLMLCGFVLALRHAPTETLGLTASLLFLQFGGFIFLLLLTRTEFYANIGTN